MRISPIGVQQNYNNRKLTQINSHSQKVLSTPSFKGDKGAVIGVIGGFAAGAAVTALTIATGGLAGVVAVVGGAGSTTLLGGAVCTHIGGIIGGLLSDD